MIPWDVRVGARMRMMVPTYMLWLWTLWTWLAPLAPAGAADPASGPPSPPAPLREFRGLWVASVANIDWPSRPGLSTAQQQAELIAILDQAVRLKLNAVILQVRPACDALYTSTREPWSEYLTGQMGQGPSPAYDPLVFAVSQAHARGLELHAWFNPFRARHASAKTPASARHVTRQHPEWVVTYGSQRWLDPGLAEARAHSLGVILDVVRRYDLDGVHLDDYFYPYRIKDAQGRGIDFPDQASWRRYQARGGKLSRADWRRQNINEFVQTLYSSVKAIKPRVKVGISPFGIWRNQQPPQIVGLDAYEELYADARQWLVNGWLDYCSPQLYWSIAAPQQSFPVLLQWWAEQNPRRRHLWPGLNAARVRKDWKPGEIVNQVRRVRAQAGADGLVLWNTSTCMDNGNGLAGALQREVFNQPALVPTSPWLDTVKPAKPKLTYTRPGKTSPWRVTWQAGSAEGAWLWVWQVRAGGQWSTEILPGATRRREVPAQLARGTVTAVALTAVDRGGNLSATVVQTLSRR